MAEPNDRSDIWRYIPNDLPPAQCWEWKGYRHVYRRYGVFNMRGRGYRAHRIVWEEHNSACLLPATVVMHLCDNPPCCNPYHLTVGLQRDNIHDMENKKRGYHKARAQNGRAKLSELDVQWIRELISKGFKGAALARFFGVSSTVVYKVRDNKLWVERSNK